MMIINVIHTSSSPQTMMSTMLWSPILSRNSTVPSRLSDVQIAILMSRSFSLTTIMMMSVMELASDGDDHHTWQRELSSCRSSWSACSPVCPSKSSPAPAITIDLHDSDVHVVKVHLGSFPLGETLRHQHFHHLGGNNCLNWNLLKSVSSRSWPYPWYKGGSSPPASPSWFPSSQSRTPSNGKPFYQKHAIFFSFSWK